MEIPKKFYELDKKSQGLKNYAELKLLERILKLKPKSILEVGCGNGHFLESFSNIERLGIDRNEGMVSLAKKNGIEVCYGDILKKDDLVRIVKKPVDVISANYVFTEMTYPELDICFQNLYEILSLNGHLCFTITNPRENYREVFPDYRAVFQEKFEYEKRDIPFIVELDDGNGNYIDVGIRDYHRPVSDYNLLLKKNRFLNTVVSEIYKNYDYPYALLFDAQK